MAKLPFLKSFFAHPVTVYAALLTHVTPESTVVGVLGSNPKSPTLFDDPSRFVPLPVPPHPCQGLPRKPSIPYTPSFSAPHIRNTFLRTGPSSSSQIFNTMHTPLHATHFSGRGGAGVQGGGVRLGVLLARRGMMSLAPQDRTYKVGGLTPSLFLTLTPSLLPTTLPCRAPLLRSTRCRAMAR